jgi:hypothetical protein
VLDAQEILLVSKEQDTPVIAICTDLQLHHFPSTRSSYRENVERGNALGKFKLKQTLNGEMMARVFLSLVLDSYKPNGKEEEEEEEEEEEVSSAVT